MNPLDDIRYTVCNIDIATAQQTLNRMSEQVVGYGMAGEVLPLTFKAYSNMRQIVFTHKSREFCNCTLILNNRDANGTEVLNFNSNLTTMAMKVMCYTEVAKRFATRQTTAPYQYITE